MISPRVRVRAGSGRRRRRGVSSVLAMMFLVIFSSLAAAMAVVAQGNLRTADSAIKVSRALSAAETGLIFASSRLRAEGKRFVISKGEVDGDYAWDLWMGSWSPADGDVEILEAEGYDGDSGVDSLITALLDAHDNTVSIEPELGDDGLPEIDEDYGILLVKPVALTVDSEGAPDVKGPYFRLKYEILADEATIRVTSQGVDGDVRRTLQMDFAIAKKIEYAVVSPARIMIGKNVRVEGPLGSLFGIGPSELTTENGDPLVMRSDFYFLDDTLSGKLDLFFDRLQDYDADGDGRLRPDHPTEGAGLAGLPDLADYDGDEYVDDFDLFLAFYDSNGDLKVVFDDALPGDEFNDDDQLARLIDEAVPDRNSDGAIDADDEALGYKDGVIDIYDRYAKVHGKLAFAVARANWEAEHGGSYQSVVQGPIRPDEPEEAPVRFEVGDDELLEVSTAMLDSSQSWFADAADGQDFGDESSGQVKWNLDNNVDAEYEAPNVDTWEAVPFGSEGAYDYYQRAVYRNMRFEDVVIPKGTNGLFENCTFVGVTYVETNTDCDHINWNYAGALEETDDDVFELKFPDLVAQYGPPGSEVDVNDTREESNNIRFHSCTFLGSVSGDKPNEYTHWRNKLQFTGDTRFYIDVEDPDLLDQDDAEDLIDELEALDEGDVAELEKSSILAPGWSVDVGSFDNSAPKVKLKGTIVAGILDARGVVDIFGTLMMTFRAVEGEGPLFYGGQPDAFNTTIGYFGPDDGDGEGMSPSHPDFPGYGEISLRYNPDARLPDGIPWPISIRSAPTTYIEGGSI